MIRKPLNTLLNKLKWRTALPFSHIVVDNFFKPGVAIELAGGFPAADSDFWFEYKNPLEIKKAGNYWTKFPKPFYKVFTELCGSEVCRQISDLCGTEVEPDYGLHGGGLHLHGCGGKLNTHLDYDIHPKLDRRRKVNIIVYLTPDWQSEWGGQLGLWTHNPYTDGPGKLVKEIVPVFNRAVIFDTSQQSWHGLPEPINCPSDVARTSLAMYYTCTSSDNGRNRALFAPAEDQRGDEEVKKLIIERSRL